MGGEKLRRGCRPAGCLFAVIGILIILWMVLPPDFWWFLLGAIFIAIGIAIIKKC
jgi:hypothetical protein